MIKKYETNLYISKSDIEGEGLFSKINIHSGKVICKIADLYNIDSTEEWMNDWCHKVNHSINATAKVIIVGNKCLLQAIKDIKAGEEITTDYRTLPDFFNKGIYEK